MKKIATLLLAACLLPSTALGVTASADSAQKNTASDWMPHNYVMTEGFGLNLKKVDVRTWLDYSNDQLRVYGNTSKGGVGVTYLPEINLDDFTMELSLDNWQVNSTDKWFGLTFMDKGEKSDMFNEVPFYSKHSESWDNEYGAGEIFGFRPFAQTGEGAQPGVLQIQFNNVGIEHSYSENNAGGNYQDIAGEYSNGKLGWTGYLSTIQLCDSNWQPVSDYSNIKITIKKIENADGKGHDGYAFNFNDGYWYRTEDSIVWPWDVNGAVTDQTVYDMLDVNGDDSISEEEKNLFRRGPAYTAEIDGKTYESHVQFLNYGDPLHNLYNFNQNLKNNGKRLYLNVLYKDAFNMPEGENAQFTVKSVNGMAATSSETLNLGAEKVVTEGDITATVKEENVHAGVYPSKIKSLTTATAQAKNYAKAAAAIEEKATELGKKCEVINFVGEVQLSAGFVNVELQNALSLTYKTAKQNVQIFKVNNSTKNALEEVALTAVEGGYTFDIDGSSIYAIYYTAGNVGGNGGGDASEEGCGSTIGGGIAVLSSLMLAAAVMGVSKKKTITK